MDGDVDVYMDSVQANVLGQVGSSDPSGSTWSSKLVDTYPTMSEDLHNHLASWACWSEKVIRLVMLLAAHSGRFIPTNIHHQVPSRGFVKLLKGKDTFHRMLKNNNRDWRHGPVVCQSTPTDAPRIEQGDARTTLTINRKRTDDLEVHVREHYSLLLYQVSYIAVGS